MLYKELQLEQNFAVIQFDKSVILYFEDKSRFRLYQSSINL